MKRIVAVSLVVAGLATAANAAQVNFFLTSPQATNGVTSGLAGATLQANPIIAPGPATVELWMQLDSSLFPQGGTSILFGGQLGVSGASAGTSTLGGPNPAAAWAAGYTAGAAGNAWGPVTFLSQNAGLGTAGTTPSAGGPLFLIGSGTINAAAGDSLYITLPVDQTIGTNGSLTIGGLAFGWTGGAGFGPGGPDISGVSGSGPQPMMSDFDAGFSANAGFVGASLDSTQVKTTIADLTVLPEPTTMALLCLGGLMIRRRK